MRHQHVFSRNPNDLGCCDKIKHQIKLNKDAQLFRRSYCSMIFDKRKPKKMVEDLEDAQLIELTHLYWVAPSKLVKKKDFSYRLVVDYRGLKKNWENQLAATKNNCYFFNIVLTSGYFQMALDEEPRTLQLF